MWYNIDESEVGEMKEKQCWQCEYMEMGRAIPFVPIKNPDYCVINPQPIQRNASCVACGRFKEDK